MARVDPVAELAAKLLHALEQQRQSGGDYPLIVGRLAALADPQATPEQVAKALAKRPFAARWVVANKKDANSPIALAEDRERLAVSPHLVEYALELLCNADSPLHTPAKVAAKVDTSLRPTFKAALDRQIAANSLPATVGVRMVRSKPQLYLQQFPPKDPIEELSKKLVEALTQQRERRPDDYPTPLPRLIERTGLSVKPAELKQAFGREPFRGQAVVAMPSLPDSLVALSADAERLASSPALLHRALTAARTADNQALTLADLKKKIAPSLQGPFVASLDRRLSGGALPDGIGVLRSKKKPLFFLLADLNATPPAAAPTAPPKPVAPPSEPKPTQVPVMDFARRFEEAFAHLDREHGSHNHVSLVDLRRSLPVDRAAFDAGVQQLRRAGRYGLSAAEGRHGLSADEREAGIIEDGSLLLFVSRRET
jgi:hypothetical protein